MMQQLDFPLPENVLPLEQALALSEEGTVVIHANPPQFQLVLCRLGRKFLANKRVVGYWAWELEGLPSIWKQALDYVDALEVPSTFVRDAVKRHTSKPVSVIPHVVPALTRCKERYAEDGIVRCLYCFDLGSSFERKNPLAALQAFSMAFKPGEAELTLKVSGAREHEDTFSILRNACSNISDVHIIDQILSRREMEDLYLRHDIYLSSHRSEGYGLTIQEAMLHGLHVVATGWSGNMDFMTGELAHPVSYTLVPVHINYGPWKGMNSRWADVNVQRMSILLRSLAIKFRHMNNYKIDSAIIND
ncbi:MAG: glycosyltransferase [Desulfovibrionaceae bacterium]|nr:glycosyltransferase [Desulfovibrionaceae bacterium]